MDAKPHCIGQIALTTSVEWFFNRIFSHSSLLVNGDEKEVKRERLGRTTRISTESNICCFYHFSSQPLTCLRPKYTTSYRILSSSLWRFRFHPCTHPNLLVRTFTNEIPHTPKIPLTLLQWHLLQTEKAGFAEKFLDFTLWQTDCSDQWPILTFGLGDEWLFWWGFSPALAALKIHHGTLR
ncbi:hypothetical protein TNCT_686251 [Trichonephila clavata]|uniref:Uncharacterized protein n=1 Tax=Trichonephila clavata TaxID=2740835 RepID=A0A8X6HEZ3_TRICU|nr:hypothetical protein TNCT_686251 [Trichonephila clavata]